MLQRHMAVQLHLGVGGEEVWLIVARRRHLVASSQAATPERAYHGKRYRPTHTCD